MGTILPKLFISIDIIASEDIILNTSRRIVILLYYENVSFDIGIYRYDLIAFTL